MDTSEDQFQEEVLQLFAEEGLEWIKQIKVALQELESGVTLDKEKKHYDIILRSLTNLMGSAATVELAALQKLTLALVPLLRSEEHTSELQSLTNLVCRLLLEKKKFHPGGAAGSRPRHARVRARPATPAHHR